MISLSKANVADAGAIYLLLEQHKAKFLDDYAVLTPDWVLHMIGADVVMVIRDGVYPVGVGFVTDQFHDLHAVIHFVINPKHLKAVIKSNFIPVLIDLFFEHTGVLMLKALILEHNKSWQGLAKKYRFKNKGIDENYTRCNGKMTDLFRFELKRIAWNKWRKPYGQ